MKIILIYLFIGILVDILSPILNYILYYKIYAIEDLDDWKKEERVFLQR